MLGVKKMKNIVITEIDMNSYANVYCYEENESLFFANVKVGEIDELIRALESLKSKLKPLHRE